MAGSRKTSACFDQVVGDLLADYKSLHYEVAKRKSQLATLHQHLLDKTFPRDLSFKIGPPQLPATMSAFLAKDLLSAEAAGFLTAKTEALARRAQCYQSFVEDLQGKLLAYDNSNYILDLVVSRLPVMRDDHEGAKQISYNVIVLISNFRQSLKAQEAPTASAGPPMDIAASTDTAVLAAQLATVLKTVATLTSEMQSLKNAKRLPHATSASAVHAPRSGTNPDHRKKSASVPKRKETNDTADRAVAKPNRKQQRK
jgi:hypothetical protein